MAVGILIDTFVVRSLLVPSLLALFARDQRRESPQKERNALGDDEGALHR